MSEYDVLSLVKQADGKYQVDPAVMFPATVQRIKNVLAGEPPVEIVSKGWTGNPWREPVTDRTLREAEAFMPHAWDLALEPYDANTAPHLQALRSAALAFVESWFKRALALKVGPPVVIHISKNLDYRRV